MGDLGLGIMGGASASLKANDICSFERQNSAFSSESAEVRHRLLRQKSCLTCSGRLSPQWASSFPQGVAVHHSDWWQRLRADTRARCLAEPDGRSKRIFIFGMGYTALALAAWLQRENWIVSGTCRTKEKQEALKLRGFDTFLFNPDNDGEEMQLRGLTALKSATHVLSTVPPVGDFDKDPVLGSHYDDLVHLGALRKLQWIGILSSTGVYGDHRGEWVDEDTEVRPEDRRALARVEAEKSWLQLGKDIETPVQIFRLGGIYGPGRSAWETVLRPTAQLSARQKMREGRQYTSRVHVADICQVVLASIQYPRTGRVFNVVDDDPAPRSLVMEFARKLREGCSAIPSSMEADMMDARPPTAGKRVVNMRIKNELHVKLLYPSYKVGLKAIAEGVTFPFGDSQGNLPTGNLE